jgi:hypothetical protein
MDNKGLDKMLIAWIKERRNEPKINKDWWYC